MYSNETRSANRMINYDFDNCFLCIFTDFYVSISIQSESDLLIRTYGDRSNCADVLALRHLVSDCGEHMMKVRERRDNIDLLIDW